MLLGFVETIRGGKDMPTMLATLEREHAANYDMGILELGLASYNVRYFDVDHTEGPYAGELLRQEGLARALYIDFYIHSGRGEGAPAALLRLARLREGDGRAVALPGPVADDPSPGPRLDRAHPT